MKPVSFAQKSVVTAAAAVFLASASIAAVQQFVPTTPASASVTTNTAPTAGFADLVEKVMPAVISVEVEFQPASFDGGIDGMPQMPDLPPDSPFRHFFEQFKGNKRFAPPQAAPRRQGQGSGFIISEDGFAVTNNHVVDGASQVSIRLNDGRRLTADVIGTDAKTDLALLKIKSNDTFTHVKFAEDKARVGDWVVAVGNPFGLGGTVTTGVVSAKGRNIGSGPYDDYLQIDASINRGNSGGPAFNLKGEVIGVNTAIFSPSGGSVGIGFAIPADLTQSVIDDLKDDGAVTRGWLGVQIQPISHEIAESIGLAKAKGAIVADVTEGSPAQEGGLKVGDTILMVNGAEVEDPRDLALKISRINPGDKAKVTVWRNGKEKQISLRIGSMPGQKQAAMKAGKTPTGSPLAQTGMKLADSEDGQGAVVVSVKPGSAAHKAGLRRGDVIKQAAGLKVEDADDVAEALQEAAEQGLSRTLMLVKSGNGQRFVALPSTTS
jgi:serine protease Do